MRINTTTRQPDVFTHEGAPASKITPEQQLRRSVMSCLLWEDSFYEDGVSIADRIAGLIKKVKPEKVAQMAIDARNKMKLRHTPLYLARLLAKEGYAVAPLLYEIIQRPDELAEFLSLYWKDGKQPLSAQVKKGLAKAFTKFDEYQLAKYNRPKAIKLRDVLFLSHAKPINDQQAILWKKLVDNNLEIPDTWEVELSKSTDKKASWERLLNDDKLGALALLRNLRNMQQAGVNPTKIRTAIDKMKTGRVLPFRFIAAAKHAIDFEPDLENSMLSCIDSHPKFGGKTVLLVDVSGSMDWPLSNRSELNRLEAASALSILLRGITNEISIYTFSEKLVKIPPRSGFALRDAIYQSQPHSSTYLGEALANISEDYDRIIVITDEQSADKVPAPRNKGYMINVSNNTNGVGYGPWIHIDGWSESIINFIQEHENLDFNQKSS